MPGKQAVVQHHPEFRQKHGQFPSHILKFTEGQRGMQLKPYIKRSPVLWD